MADRALPDTYFSWVIRVNALTPKRASRPLSAPEVDIRATPGVEARTARTRLNCDTGG
jgi:hypothetical protein